MENECEKCSGLGYFFRIATSPDGRPSYGKEVCECMSVEQDGIDNSRLQNFYYPTVFPKRVNGESFSVDVFIIDENGMHGIGFYDFELKKWVFHTDTLVDYDEEGAETKWKWYYPPYEVNQVFQS